MEILKGTDHPSEPVAQPIPTGQEPVAAPVAAEPTPSTPAEDLLSRVSKFQKDKAPVETPQPNNTEGNFDIKEIEAITDPVAKDQAMRAYKSFQRGYGEKFQELSQLKKEMEAIKSQPIQVQAPAPVAWTRERVEELARDPQFVEAAKQVAGTPVDENSTMSEAEQVRINELNQKITKLEAANNQALTQQQQALRDQHHQTLGAKYDNYVSKEIDTITYDMIEGRITTTPEHIYKAFKHDENVENAYYMGRKDERNGVSEKIQSASVEGIHTLPSTPAIVPKEGQSSKSFFNDIIAKNLNAVARR